MPLPRPLTWAALSARRSLPLISRHPRLPAFLGAGLVLLTAFPAGAAIAGGITEPLNPDDPRPPQDPVTDGEPTFADEFSGPSLDLGLWRHRGLGDRRGGVNVEEAVSVSDGYLTIRTWTEGGIHYSGMIGTHETFQQAYGYWEARIDFDGASGMWGNFWLQSPDIDDTTLAPETAGVELDIVEAPHYNGNGDFIGGKASLNTHWGGYGPDHQTRHEGTPWMDLHEGFHTYGLAWSPDGYRFYIDDQFMWDGEDTPISTNEQYIVLAQEVAGPNETSWVGEIPTVGYGSFEETEALMRVDYVRVYSGAAPVPEPTALVLVGFAGLGLLRRRGAS